MNFAQVTGRDDSFLVRLETVRLETVQPGPVEQGSAEPGHRLHPEAREAFLRLQARAAAAGFDLQPASSYRSFERQLAIWNAKAKGERAVHDATGRILSRAAVSDWDWVQAILRFSALPGASRHHWGSDLDVYDAGAVPGDYAVRLTPAEVAAGGPFAPLHDWLDSLIAADDAEGFYRPYAVDRGGVAPERWHLSYAPVARCCAGLLSAGALRALLADSAALELWPTVAAHWEDIYARFAAPDACKGPGEEIDA